jgi:hypothetical protein
MGLPPGGTGGAKLPPKTNTPKPKPRSLKEKLAARNASRDAAQGITPEMRAALEQSGGFSGGLTNMKGLGESLKNLTPAQQADLQKGITAGYKPGQLDAIKASDAERAKNAAINKRFGNDMAWLDPEFEEKAALLGQSARSQVFADPELIGKQNQALDSLFGIAKDGGASAQERARRAGARADSEDWLRGQRDADMENLSERGMSGSGSELLALGNDRQAAAQRNSKADLETDAWLEQRALDAMQAGGDLAGKMRDTGFSEGIDRAGAEDDRYQLNQQALNAAESNNRAFKQRGYTTALNNRFSHGENLINQGIGAATGLAELDERENEYGYQYGSGLATHDANAFNNASGALRGTLTQPIPGKAEATKDFQDAGIEGLQHAGQGFGSWTNFLGNAAMGGGGAAGGAGGAAGAATTWAPQVAGGQGEDEDKTSGYA